MADAFVIEVSRFTAGIVAGQRKGFRFYASHPAMAPLEGRVFGSPLAAQKAAEKLAAQKFHEEAVGSWRKLW
jgi:hypothetical protein